jgi:DegV family protein with EDD domain
VIAIVTDSSAQLPDTLAAELGVSRVPVRVTVDGTEYREGVDLDADAFYGFWTDGAQPTITTSQPTPGDFVDCYRRLSADGASEILSIHVGRTWSGTCDSARIAARQVDVPVTVIDSGSLSFGVACCVREAAAAIAAGADLVDAARVVAAVAPTISSVTVIGALDIARAGGRFTLATPAPDGAAAPVIRIAGEETSVVGSGSTVDELAELMAATMTADPRPQRMALCMADATAEPLRTAMDDRLRGHPGVADLVRYRVGPSIGAHTGPGTAGGFWYPARESWI